MVMEALVGKHIEEKENVDDSSEKNGEKSVTKDVEFASLQRLIYEEARTELGYDVDVDEARGSGDAKLEPKKGLDFWQLFDKLKAHITSVGVLDSTFLGLLSDLGIAHSLSIKVAVTEAEEKIKSSIAGMDDQKNEINRPEFNVQTQSMQSMRRRQELIVLKKKCQKLKSENQSLKESLKDLSIRLRHVKASQKEEIRIVKEEKDREIYFLKKNYMEKLLKAQKDINGIFVNMTKEIEIGSSEFPVEVPVEVIEIDTIELEKQTEQMADQTTVRNKPQCSFPCNFPGCGKTFSRKFNLQLHSRVHSEYRPEKCSMCSKSFSHSSNLKRHLRTHTAI